jgi:hypothetical protein
MPKHKVYLSIVKAIKNGELQEPFTVKDFKRACPNLGEGTYPVFLNKHRVGNPGGNTELFIRIAPGLFKMVRPYRYQN